ncbi:MAG: biosynthetic peptidoglycan transglycosylase [Kofleriaceae bacterium]|nr:biosynthetic peptidoglycan transglycosylase [Kofleriaceae bacterium]
MSRRDRYVLAATALVAVGVPVGAAAWVANRTEALAAHLGAAGGVPVRIGRVDASLTGSIRLSEVALGDVFAAEAISASVALPTLLDGELRADEIEVASPRVALEIDAHGDSDAARLARRLIKGGRGTGHGAGGKLRRIVVSSGALSARIAGVGELAARDVELVPDAGGVRILTGALEARGSAGAVTIDVGFARSSAELSLSTMTFGRLLAVGGAGTITARDRTIDLREVAAGRLTAGGPLEAQAAVDDQGIARPVSLELALSRTSSEVSLALHGEHVPLAGLAALAPSGIVIDGARASGTLALRSRAGTHELRVDGTIERAAIHHRAVATAPVPVDATLRGTLAVAPDVVTLTDVAVDTGAIRLHFGGWLRRSGPLAAQLDARLETAPCADLLASVPAEVRGSLDGMVLQGSIGGSARLALDLAAPEGQAATLAPSLLGGCEVLAEAPAADVGSLTSVGTEAEGYVVLKDIPDRVRGAFVSAEDGRFWDHRGFDTDQILRSLEIDLRERRLARGGSTISQQLVKNAFLTHRRTLDRKLQEAVLTWRLEAKLSKRQILERYLNIVELGPRIVGIGAAARHWFDTTPRELTNRQAAFLAAMTSEPTTMSRRVRKHGGLDPDSAERVATILRAMKRDGVIDADEYEAAKNAGLMFARTALGGEL